MHVPNSLFEEPVTMLEDAHTALHSGDIDRAESIANLTLSKDPENPQAGSIMAAIALRRGDALRSLEWANRVFASGYADAMILGNAGEAHRRLGNFQQAAEYFERALKIDNMNAVLHFNMGVVMRQMENAPLSEHFFRSALIVDPMMGAAHCSLAELYRDEGHLREAEGEYRSAVRCQPTDSKSLARLGNLLIELGRPAAAIDVLLQASEADKNAVDPFLDLAKAYFEMCYESAASDALVRAIELSDPSSMKVQLRVSAVRRESLRTNLGSNGSDFGVLSRERALNVPPIRTIPARESGNFIVGVPVAPEIFWTRMRNVEVLPEEFSVIGNGRCLYVDDIVNWAQFYRHRSKHVHHESDDMRVLLKIPRKTRMVDAPCVLIGGGGDDFAWMYECLPRLWSAEQVPEFCDAKVIVPENLSQERIEMLAIFGVEAERLLLQPSSETILARNILVPSLLTVGDWVSPIALQYLRRRLSTLPVTNPSRRIFLSGGAGSTRRIENGEEVCARLRAEGFEIISSVHRSTLEKIERIRDAAVVLCMDNDDLALLPVLPQGAWVGAITPQGLYRPRGHFVASQLGINLQYLFGLPRFTANVALEQCNLFLEESVLDEFISAIG
jgi:tetratricopeptide (TPR) repeat protein/capsular polysaccharide biosynthesis protein